MNTASKVSESVRRGGALAALAAAGLASGARAQSQVVFGIDYRGATISTPDSVSTTPITEADILKAPFGIPSFGPLPAPQIAFTGAQLGLSAYATCVGHAAGTACRIEVDAISFGKDAPFTNLLPPETPGRARLYFSVDRFATGVVGSGIAPNVRSEGALGALEAAGDVFTVVTTITGPINPTAATGLNFGVFDGDGLPSASGHRYRGLGLREPSAVGPYDDIDALAIGPIPSGPGAFVYYSLDGGIVDPITSQTGSDSAGLQGVSPSAILRRSLSGGAITIYANPVQLGLNPLTDDLDALLVSENGDGVYQPSMVFYDWLTGSTDMVLFSVRRGSAILGQSDSLFGAPIEAGDILAPPLTPGQRPRIFIPAEALGLATERHGAMHGDELDALGSEREPYLDCNNNGRDDAEDIALGFSSDTNNNNIPDECEQSYTRYCYCPSPLGPCGNDDATAGCKNITGQGGLLCGARTTSVATDDLEISAQRLPPGTPALLFMGPGQVLTPFGNGLLCIGPATYRMLIQFADLAGNCSYGPGFVAMSNGVGGSAVITAGSTWNFQAWYRDAASYCTNAGYNLTNGLSVLFTP